MSSILLTADVMKAIHASADFTAKSDAQGIKLFAAAFTAEVLADKVAFTAARNEWQTRQVTKHGVSPETARTNFYRVLKQAGIAAPGKNSGENNGNAGKGKTAVDFSPEALLAAYKAQEWSKCRAIINAAQAAAKTQTVGTDTDVTDDAEKAA